ncbi:MAG TPA: hypothetical protein VFN55_00060 [Solirubrobacteraceae bacterium]|nr:hypothetical protein [Solirubrobacteraceae bacterium]
MTLRFPGQSAWSGEFCGRPRIRQWLQRFVNLGLQIQPDGAVGPAA